MEVSYMEGVYAMYIAISVINNSKCKIAGLVP